MKKFKWIAMMSMVLFFTISSCKKDKDDDDLPLLSTDPNVHPSFGQKINFNEGNSGGVVTWGRNSNELVAGTLNKFLQINLDNSTITTLSETNGAFTQKTADMRSIVFIGIVNGEHGYYSLNLDTKEIRKLLSVSINSGTDFDIANDDMFLFSGTVTSTGRPCTSIWDFWCGVGTTLTNTSFYHYNKLTGSSMYLPGKRFVTFSKDYSKALLSDDSGNNGSKYVVFDFATQKISDSLVIPWNRGEHGSFYWDNTLMYAYSNYTLGEIIVINPFTDKEIYRFQSKLSRFSDANEKLIWSADGSKIYYTGSCKTADCTYAIDVIDINSGSEKKLVLTTSKEPQTSPFEKILPSDDDTKLVFRSVNSSYLKKL